MAQNQQQDKWRQRELGTLYKKTSNDGSKTFLTGKINGKKVVVFSNAEYKEKRANEGADQETVDRLPDYTVYESEDQNSGGSNGGGNYNNQRGGGGYQRSNGGGQRSNYGGQRGGGQRSNGNYSNRGGNQPRRSAPPQPAPQQQSEPGPLAETDDVPY